MAIRAPAVRKPLSADALFGWLRTGFADIADPEFEEPRHTLANSKRKNKENPGRASPILSQNIDTRIWKILLTFLCETPIV